MHVMLVVPSTTSKREDWLAGLLGGACVFGGVTEVVVVADVVFVGFVVVVFVVTSGAAVVGPGVVSDLDNAKEKKPLFCLKAKQNNQRCKERKLSHTDKKDA